MSKAKKSGSTKKRNAAGKHTLKLVKQIAQGARAEIAKVERQDQQLRVTLGGLAITADRLRKQRRFLVRVISELIAPDKAIEDGWRIPLELLDRAPTVGFAIDGDRLVILAAPEGPDPDPGPVDRDVIGKLAADDVVAEQQIGHAAEAGADAILSLDEDE